MKIDVNDLPEEFTKEMEEPEYCQWVGRYEGSPTSQLHLVTITIDNRDGATILSKWDTNVPTSGGYGHAGGEVVRIVQERGGYVLKSRPMSLWDQAETMLMDLVQGMMNRNSRQYGGDDG